MPFTVNLKETPITPGTYLAEVRKAKETKTKKGDPMVIVTWALLDGPEAGRTVDDFISFVSEMVGRNNHLLRVLGQPHSAEVAVDAAQWVGAQCRLKLTIEALPNGMPRTRVAEYLYLDEPDKDALPF